MHYSKTVVAFLLVFFTALFGQSALTAENDDDYTDPLLSLRTGPVILAKQNSVDSETASLPGSSLRDLTIINGDNNNSATRERLRKYYNPTVLKIRAPLSVRVIVKAGLTAIWVIPTFNTSVPACLGSLGEMGVTEQMFPQSVAIGTIAPPVVMLGSMAVFNHASRIFTKVPEDVLRIQEAVTDHPYFFSHLNMFSTNDSDSWYMKWTYSGLNILLEEALLGMLWGGIITYLERHLDSSWGPYWAYALVFSALYLFPLYGMTVGPTNDPDDNPFRTYETDEDREEHQKLVDVVQCGIEQVQNGKEQVREVLAEQLNVIQRQLPPAANSPLLAAQRDQSDSAPASPLSSHPNIAKDAYVNLFDYLIEIYNSQPSYTKAWRKARQQIAKWGSVIIEGASLPMRTMVSYALPYLFLEYFISTEWAIAGGVASAILFSPTNIASAYKELPLVRDELINLMRLYPPNSPPCWGNQYLSFIPDRLQALASISLSTLYIVIPEWVFLRHVVLEHVFDIHSLPSQLILILPYLAGTPFSSARQFAAEQLSHIHNWVSTGMPINACKKLHLLPCCPNQHVNALVEGQMVIKKLDEVKRKTKKLNKEHRNYLRNQTNSTNHPPAMHM